MTNIKQKHILLGVTGSIASYKSLYLASRLIQMGANLSVIMTRAATKFISPLAFESITHKKVITDIFTEYTDYPMQHISLGSSLDAIVVAPATAQSISKIANGLANDALSLTILSSKAPLIIAPAMDGHMLENNITQENIDKLKKFGALFINNPTIGRLASGLYGKGRLPEIELIIDEMRFLFNKNGDLKGKNVVITAGGTREAIDPVRYISNESSGKMGYALAIAARDRGANVTLITATKNNKSKKGIKIHTVVTAEEMFNKVKKSVTLKTHLLIMAAAVSDFKPKVVIHNKLKKNNKKEINIKLESTKDILQEINGNFVKIGFAAETEKILNEAQKKLTNKNLDLIVANDITRKDSGFSTETNKVWIINKNKEITELPTLTKFEVANKILDQAKPFLG
jgi:phosphopantothenoylcysteine decarboxylase/phosphopantothenate--cysteine ligase